MPPKDDQEQTITVRIPGQLKTAVERFAETRGASLTSVVRDALEDAVAPRGRTFELPGLSRRFDDFIEQAGRGLVLVLVTNDRGDRSFFEGSVHKTYSNPSIVTLEVHGGEEVTIMRRDVAGWFDAREGSLNKMAALLRRSGWMPWVPRAY